MSTTCCPLQATTRQPSTHQLISCTTGKCRTTGALLAAVPRPKRQHLFERSHQRVAIAQLAVQVLGFHKPGQVPSGAARMYHQFIGGQR